MADVPNPQPGIPADQEGIVRVLVGVDKVPFLIRRHVLLTRGSFRIQLGLLRSPHTENLLLREEDPAPFAVLVEWMNLLDDRNISIEFLRRQSPSSLLFLYALAYRHSMTGLQVDIEPAMWRRLEEDNSQGQMTQFSPAAWRYFGSNVPPGSVVHNVMSCWYQRGLFNPSGVTVTEDQVQNMPESVLRSIVIGFIQTNTAP